MIINIIWKIKHQDDSPTSLWVLGGKERYHKTGIENHWGKENRADCVLNRKNKRFHSLEDNLKGCWRSQIVSGILDSDGGKVSADLGWRQGLRRTTFCSPPPPPFLVSQFQGQWTRQHPERNPVPTFSVKEEIKAWLLVQTLRAYPDLLQNLWTRELISTSLCLTFGTNWGSC